MSTAIIGLGNIGTRVAKNLAAGGENIIVADKTLAKAEKLAGELDGNAEAMPVADAIGKADVVILAIYFDVIKQLVAEYRGVLAGKIIFDPSNPIAPDGKGGFKKTIPAEQSSGQLISALLPERRSTRQSIRHVKCGVPGDRREPFPETRGTVLCDGPSGGRQDHSKAHCRERIFAPERRRNRQVHPDRSGRRPARVREAWQARVHQRG
jgi:hypothetical protein